MPGTTLGPYRILSELGAGGMGTVWLAEAVERCAVPAGARVALKVVHPHLLAEPGFFKRFLREAEIGKAVIHPNVVRCHDADAVLVGGEQRNFLVMEYVEGQTLRELLDEMETVPEELCRHIGREVSRGLAAIHAAGVVHRDLKPANVLITPEHQVKIMDLGLARVVDDAIRLSRSGAFVGSVLYAAPEQFGEGDPDGRADLFSLGVILYELSCGVHPHPGHSFTSVLARLVEGEPRRLGEQNPQLSPFFEEVVHRLLAREPSARFASAARLRDVLGQGEGSAWWKERARSIRNETRRPLRRIRIPRETAVYGREQELARLLDLHRRAAGGDGQVVLVEGEAGVGKSRLVDELAGRLHREGEDFDFLFGGYPPGGAATVASAWSAALLQHLGEEDLPASLARHVGGATALVPAFAALLRGEPAPGGDVPLTRESLQTAFRQVARSLAAERTTVLLIEDLHFAPEEGRALFAALAHAAAGQRILLVGTTRPGLSGKWRAELDRLDHTTPIHLERLGREDLAALLVEAFQSASLAGELGSRIAAKSDGNPFFAFEIVRGMREGRLITRLPDGSWAATSRIDEIEIPSSVTELVQARISELGEEEREVLEVAACLGFDFDPLLLAEVLGRPPIPVLRLLGRLEQAHRLVRSAGRGFVFDHHQVQDALYRRLSVPLAEQYHRAIAEALGARHPEPDGETAARICEHHLRGAAPERSLAHLITAIDHLRAGYAGDRAVDLCRRALDAPGLLDTVTRARILLKLAALLLHSGRSGECGPVVAEALALADESGEGGLRSATRRMQAVLLGIRGQNDEARRFYEEARSIAAERSDHASLGSVEGGLALLLFAEGRLEEAREKLESWIDLARKAGDRSNEGRAEINLAGVGLALGDDDFAREHYERANALARDSGDRVAEGATHAGLAYILDQQGLPAEARRRYLRALEISRETGNRRGEVSALNSLAQLDLTLGRPEEARQSIEQALAILREGAIDPAEASESGSLTTLALARGDLDRARELAGRAVAQRRGVAKPDVLTASLVRLGRICRLGGREEEARRAFEEAAAQGEVHPDASMSVLARCYRGSVGAGDVASAVELLEEKGRQIPVEDRMVIRHFLWQTTGSKEHLLEAWRLLRHLRDHAPEECRESMIARVPLHRDIAAAWEEHGVP